MGGIESIFMKENDLQGSAVAFELLQLSGGA
jgi:hypothetical protein